jgi:hypothetical protein
MATATEKSEKKATVHDTLGKAVVAAGDEGHVYDLSGAGLKSLYVVAASPQAAMAAAAEHLGYKVALKTVREKLKATLQALAPAAAAK